MLELPNVSLLAVTSLHFEETERAIKKSREGIMFAETIYITDADIKSSDEYSRYMLYEAGKHVKTPFALVIQYDGYVLRPDLWTDEFLAYDYIGAPWPPKMHYTKEGEEVRVGNGGFSLRSKKLMDAFNELKLPFTDNGTGFFHEDGQICNYHRKTLEDYGIKFAPVELAARFSTELKVPETTESFGGHKYIPWKL